MFRDNEKCRCAICARYSAQRKLANTPEIKAATEMAHIQHVRQVFKDRGEYSRMQRLSVESCRPLPGTELQSNEDSVLCIAIDAMDQVIE